MVEKKTVNEEVKKVSKNEAPLNEAEIQARARAYEMELVSVKLFKDTGRYKDDVTVHVNGKNWQIKRGIEVQIPRYVARVLATSDKQDFETAMMIEAKQEEYENMAKTLNI